MRTLTIVVVTYLTAVVVSAVWRSLPVAVISDYPPALGALLAGYLGLTARQSLAPAMAAAALVGYVLDIVGGTPAGYTALVLVLVCLLAFATQRRLVVRGTPLTLAFSAAMGASASFLGWMVRLAHGMSHGAAAQELVAILLIAATTAIAGPPIFRVFRRIEAMFARTQREREAALEGLAP